MSLDEADDEGDDERIVVVEVWECLLPAVEVFGLCEITGIGAGMGGLVWTGIAAQEVRAACLLRRIPLADRAQVAADVKFMGGVVAGDRNREAASKQKRA